MKKWLVAVVIVLTVGLVVLPVWTGSTDDFAAKWALARVANLAEGDADAAEAELEKVASRMAAPKMDGDYWIIRMRIALSRGDSDQAMDIALEAQETISNGIEVANLAFEHFYDRGDYSVALRLLELMLAKTKPPLHPSFLNQLAYLRSLALVDLDLGLLEINEALKFAPDSHQFIDTRAWLLFQMGRLPEALDDANRAVKLATRVYEREREGYQGRFLRWLNGKSSPSSPDGLLTMREAGESLWTLGALRYHRGKILEALDRTEEAEMDWLWLREQRLPQDERLR